ncbi:MAG: ADP-ribosylglycohydrolase family protein, partial [Ignavibacteria bacterium]|nr:ADP-ribosylglycohydrolase family protein [Ignavibacteria bacterium]
QDPIRGGVSTQAALHNLRNEIKPPQSGKQNPHYFDDGAMSRAVPIGIICAGQPDKAAQLASIDASITNSEDGVWAAQAMAVAVSLLCAGENIKDAISGAYQYLPESSWIKRSVDDAMKIVEKTNSIFSIIPEIQNNIVNREYSYGNAAPETLALSFIIVQLHGNNFETAVTTSLSFAKSGETLPAMVGALAGAMQIKSFTSENWLNAIGTLNGICIPTFAGKNYLKLVEEISNYAGKKISI